jgi:hypothetical protein
MLSVDFGLSVIYFCLCFYNIGVALRRNRNTLWYLVSWVVAGLFLPFGIYRLAMAIINTPAK